MIAQRLPEGVPDPALAEKAFILMLDSMGPGILTFQQSIELCQQCIGILTRLGDAWGVALAQLILADVASFGVMDAELARRSYQAGLEGFSGLGNEWGQALCLTGLAEIERRAGHLEEAYRMGCQSLDTYRQMGDAWRAVSTRQMLGEIAEGLSKFDEARSHFETNLAYFSRMGDGPGRDHCHECLERLDERARVTVPDIAPNLQREETSMVCNRDNEITVDWVKSYGKADEPLKVSWAERTHGGGEQ
jgi:hypothetical protein